MNNNKIFRDISNEQVTSLYLLKYKIIIKSFQVEHENEYVTSENLISKLIFNIEK